ncbi:MAG: DUF4097 family beta strand repeat-containing protein [Candidatus Krumholzibacteria bacterium]|nr:DUF4097 family beta strand repeat-containing protein [Candidatus Krumholzibacteria bacterium]MDP6669637.1 DUF4097 family beta strand repeat-containing protein [Candidatus Krumholzibacteria bacterium]MDP6797076.1 DUF4097 family beta strand repeat-containing protein [Candidatus Krumholzibacteria bacterium]MDP7022464.1 DUF4097 family beta strand repeat-containing protein [Candidatus Krumholzibacteria bacterium]
MKKVKLITLLLLLPLAGFAGSLIQKAAEKNVEVEGEELHYRKTVEVETVLPGEFNFDAYTGTLVLKAHDLPSAIFTIEYYEYEEDDVTLRIDEKGGLFLESRGNHSSAFGSLHALLPRSVSMELTIGAGDIEVLGFEGGNSIRLTSGVGDIRIQKVKGYRDLRAEIGMGDTRLGPASDIEYILIQSGMGSIKLKNVQAIDTELQSGMGSIRLIDCKLESVQCETGMGSIRLMNTEYEDGDFDTGMGSVKGL